MKEPKIPHQWVWTGLHKAYGERPYREMVCTVCGATGKKFGLLESASVRTDYKYQDRKSTRLNSSHEWISRMPSSA